MTIIWHLRLREYFTYKEQSVADSSYLWHE